MSQQLIPRVSVFAHFEKMSQPQLNVTAATLRYPQLKQQKQNKDRGRKEREIEKERKDIERNKKDRKIQKEREERNIYKERERVENRKKDIERGGAV